MRIGQDLIWRDDDIYMTKSLRDDRHFYSYEQFKKVHQMIRERGFIHTLAIIASEIDKYPEFTKYLLEHKNEFSFQLHGLEHSDYFLWQEEDAIYMALEKAKGIIEKTFGTKVSTFYAPYNKITDKIRSVCARLGLEVNEDYVTPEQWLMGKRSKTINFHYWAVKEGQVDALRQVLEQYEKI